MNNNEFSTRGRNSTEKIYWSKNIDSIKWKDPAKNVFNVYIEILKSKHF